MSLKLLLDMITTEKMQKIMVDITLGKKPKGRTKEEKDFIRKVSVDISDIEKKGGIVQIPSEHPLP